MEYTVVRNDDALTADEVAAMLQVSKSTVYKLVKADQLASYHIGRKMRFTLADVERYIDRSKQAKLANAQGAAMRAVQPASEERRRKPAQKPVSLREAVAATSPAPSFVLAGNDVLGDVIANYVGAIESKVDRVYEGSYSALVDVYLGRAHAALVHLYDGATDSYNVRAVDSLVPGLPVRVVRLVRRKQGLIVAKGNPLGLRTWEDAFAPDVRWINRERGCGSRILLDEKLTRCKVDRVAIRGYEREASSALSMASFVARGAADVGIGAERVYRQVDGVDFLPLEDEWLDLALLKLPQTRRVVETISTLTRTRAFREEVAGIVGYDASEMGKVVFER